MAHSPQRDYDLDNTQLGKLFPGDNALEAIFQLDYIVIEGPRPPKQHTDSAAGIASPTRH